jgi:MFS family permease
MNDKLNAASRSSSVKPNIILTLGLILMGNAVTQQIAGIVAISGFLSSGDANQILWVWLIDYTLILIVSGLQTLIVDKFDRVRLMAGISFAFATAFVILRLMFAFNAPKWLNYSVMYLLAEQQFLFFPLVFWVLANDVIPTSQTKRMFPIISSWNFAGKLLGIGIVVLLPAWLHRMGIQTEEILLLGALIYTLICIWIRLRLKNVRIRKTIRKREPVRITLSEGWKFVRSVDSFRYLMMSLLAMSLCVTIVEFRFLGVTETVFTDELSYQRFYSLYRLIASVISFFLQMLITGWLIERISLKNAFFIFPSVVLISLAGMLFLPAMPVAVAAMLISKLTRETIQESVQKSFQSLVPEERRGRVSTFMDNYLFAFGIILACFVIGGILLISPMVGQDAHLIYLTAGVLGAIFGIWTTAKMRTVYDSSMFNWRLKRRQRGSSVLDNIEF